MSCLVCKAVCVAPDVVCSDECRTVSSWIPRGYQPQCQEPEWRDALKCLAPSSAQRVWSDRTDITPYVRAELTAEGCALLTAACEIAQGSVVMDDSADVPIFRTDFGLQHRLVAAKLGLPVTRALELLAIPGGVDEANWSFLLQCRALTNQSEHRIFPFRSLLRHSCAPNCLWQRENGCLIAIEDIPNGADLTIDRLSLSCSDESISLYGKRLRCDAHLSLFGTVCVCPECVTADDRSERVPCPLIPCRHQSTETTSTNNSRPSGKKPKRLLFQRNL